MITDLYYKTPSRADFISDMLTAGIELNGWESNLYNDDNITIEWVGKIPDTYELITDDNRNSITSGDELFNLQTGELVKVLSWRSNYRVNVRITGILPDLSQFVHTIQVFPVTPIRVFA